MLVDVLAMHVLEAIVVRPVFQGLTLIAAPIGFVISHVFLAVIYYLVITPIGLIFRLTGRDAIGRKIDRNLGELLARPGRRRGPRAVTSSYTELQHDHARQQETTSS